MAKQRPSVQKRERESRKRAREQEKREKAALRKELRLEPDQTDSPPPNPDGDAAPNADGGDVAPPVE